MDDVNQLFRESLDRVEKMLDTHTAVGQPIQVEGATVIPLFSTGFGFGAGTGTGPAPNTSAMGSGGGTGAGGGIRPVALVIATSGEVRVERLGRASGMESLGKAIAGAMQQRGGAGSKPEG